MRQHAFLGALILAILCAISAGAQARDRALVVGINRYPGISMNGLPADLRGAVPDARAFADALVDVFGFERGDIRLLLDGQATRGAILAGLEEWLIAGSRPGDRVVLYFAGHGATAYVTDPDGRSRLTSTLVPADAADDPVRHSVANMIEGRAIGSYLERLKDRHVTVVADSCHSGSVTRGLDGPSGDEPLVRTITPRIPIGLAGDGYTRSLQSEVKAETRFVKVGPRNSGRGSLAVWSATTLDQLAYDRKDGSGGVFTQSFVERLHKAKAPGSHGLTAGSLYNYVREQSELFCANVACPGLTPQLETNVPEYRTALLVPDRATAAPPNTATQAVADATSVLSHRNDFPLKVEIMPSPRPRLGDAVQFRITSGEAGTLVVLDSNPDGKLYQLFPSGACRNDPGLRSVRAKAPYTIPDASFGCRFIARDAGPGTLMVLVAEQALDLSRVIGAHLDLKPVSDPRGLVVEYAEAVQAAHITPDLTIPNGRYRWSFVTMPYTIAR